jgi:DNA polymerase III sliding clamp (beta) subunit (PCNA family)
VKLKVNIGMLAQALNDSSTTLDGLSQMPTANAQLDAKNRGEGDQWIYLYSTDLTSETLLKIPAQVESEGKCLFSPVQMLSGLSGHPTDGEVVISTTEDGLRLKVQYKSSRFHLGTADDTNKAVENCLSRMPTKISGTVTINAADFSEFCRRSMFCIPQDDNGQSRQVVGGMYMILNEDGSHEVQATDGSIAAQVRVTGEKSEGKLAPFMLPFKALGPVNRLMSRRRGEDIQIVPGLSGDGKEVNRIYFRSGDAIFGSRLLAGKFPNLKQVIDGAKADYVFEANREVLKSSLTRVSAFFEKGKSRAVKLELKKDRLELKSGNSKSDDIIDVVEIDHKKDPTESAKVVFHMDYLFNIVSGSTGEKITMGIKGPVDPIVITDDTDERIRSKYVLMPIKP